MAPATAPATARPPVWAFRSPMRAGCAALAALVLGFGLWSALAPLAGAIVAAGRVEVEEGRQVIQHPDGGVVAAIHVREGAAVAAGDVLVSLDGTLLESELATVEGRLFALRLRMARLLAERDDAPAPAFPDDPLMASQPGAADRIAGEARLFRARAALAAGEAEQLLRQIDQIRLRIDGIAAQRIAVGRQSDLLDEELAGQERLLARGLARRSGVLALRRERARLEGVAGELVAEGAEAEAHIAGIRLELAAVRARRSEAAGRELAGLVAEEQELAGRRRALLERIARLDLRAPVAGVVLGLAVTTPRAVIRAADPVLYLVPQDRPLRVVARVGPADIDRIFPGQPVELLVTAFPGRTAPWLNGRVALVPADAFTDPATGAGYFRLEIALDPGEAARLGDRALIPGMPAEVFIRTGTQTLLAWLVKPFTDYFRHALRED